RAPRADDHRRRGRTGSARAAARREPDDQGDPEHHGAGAVAGRRTAGGRGIRAAPPLLVAELLPYLWMPTIPQKELRNNVADILRRAEAGEEFTITVAGRPVARLGPAEKRRWVSGAGLRGVFATPA